MRPRAKDLSAKHKSIRQQRDALFLSRTIQTFFNKFTKKGKKALARTHLLKAICRARLILKRPPFYTSMVWTIKELKTPFQLVTRRQGRKTIEIPVPLRRIRGEANIIQSIYNSINHRRDQIFNERLRQEILSLTVGRADSTTHKQRSQYLSKIFEERVNVEKRWK